MVRAPWNREIQGEPGDHHEPATADRGDPQIVPSSRAADARLPERRRECRRPPLLARQHRPAGSNRTATRVDPSAHDARMRAPLAPTETRKEPGGPAASARSCRGRGATVPVFRARLKQTVWDAASRVHAIALITIAPITRPVCKLALVTPKFVVRISSHRVKRPRHLRKTQVFLLLAVRLICARPRERIAELR